jgi:hypothetical protein
MPADLGSPTNALSASATWSHLVLPFTIDSIELEPSTRSMRSSGTGSAR